VWEAEQNPNSEDDEEEVGEGDEVESKGPMSHRLSSVSVWALCPSLRPALSEYLTAAQDPTQCAGAVEQGLLRVPICFAVDASNEALLYVTRYVRCGVLLVPPESLGEDPTVLLEIMKVATRWGMQPLLEEVASVLCVRCSVWCGVTSVLQMPQFCFVIFLLPRVVSYPPPTFRMLIYFTFSAAPFLRCLKW
jgi:hypothetical protein